MYWRSGQYEVLRGRAPKDRERIVRDALARHGRATGRRFLVVVGLWFGGTITAILRTRRLVLADWKLWLIPIAGGVLFYAYLLWEINGPIRRAVEKTVAEKKRR
ncbi:MAG TPA: hypothetical protein VHO06_13095 [Polyangia bacterium]|nr:hypothetical protein [Polyangia bacterium]